MTGSGISMFSRLSLIRFLIAISLIQLENCNAASGYGPEKSSALLQDVTEIGHTADNYLPDFLGFDRSIIGKAFRDTQALANNAPGKLNINGGQAQYWTFPKKAVLGSKSPATPGLPSPIGQRAFDRRSLSDEHLAELEKRQDEVEVFISINTCNQPAPKSVTGTTAPPLSLFVSLSSSNQRPDAIKNDYAVTLSAGLGAISFKSQSDVYISVSAPSSDAFSGSYNYELTASIDDYYAKYDDESNLFFIDSDSSSALLYTNDTVPQSINASNSLFQAWLNINPLPFSIYVQNPTDSQIAGMEHSMCALQNYAQIRQNSDYDTGMTLIGGGQPKQQFHVRNLNSSSTYFAVVGIKGNSTSSGGGVVNGGGTLWSATTFTTKDSPNCALIYNLSFCSDVAYAVPSNPQTFPDHTKLAQQYDGYANASWTNFTYSLAQIPCNTTATAQYSLAVNCDNCTAAYKRWLCAVSIPRCEDFSNTAAYLQPRAIAQPFINATYGAKFANDSLFSDTNKSSIAMGTSRNPQIDTDIQPGPYREVLPCSDLCYGLVRSCPAAMQFACPLKGHGYEASYGDNIPGAALGTTCNDPGADLSIAVRHAGRIHYVLAAAVLAIFMSYMT